jgi:hypothetical protein
MQCSEFDNRGFDETNDNQYEAKSDEGYSRMKMPKKIKLMTRPSNASHVISSILRRNFGKIF